MNRFIVLVVGACLLPGFLLAADTKDDLNDPTKVDADFAVQGEYLGEATLEDGKGSDQDLVAFQDLPIVIETAYGASKRDQKVTEAPSSESPTLGLKPPPGAVVLFDGRNVEQLEIGSEMR